MFVVQTRFSPSACYCPALPSRVQKWSDHLHPLTSAPVPSVVTSFSPSFHLTLSLSLSVTHSFTHICLLKMDNLDATWVTWAWIFQRRQVTSWGPVLSACLDLVRIVYQCMLFPCPIPPLFFQLSGHISKCGGWFIVCTCALFEMEWKIKRLMSSPFTCRHSQDQINFKALMGSVMFLSSTLQIYSDLYGIISISS